MTAVTGRIGTVCAFLISFFLLFCIMIPGIFAQDETESAEIPPLQEETAVVLDPYAEAEREFTIGGPGTSAVQGNPASVWTIIRVLLVLVVVAAAIYGVVFFIKRAGKVNVSKDPFLKVLANTQLGVNRSAYVLSVGTQAWLVGAAENGVHLIAEIKDKDILDAMLLEESQRTALSTRGNFPDFKTLLGRLGVKVDAGAPGPENIRKHSDRLKGL